MYSILRIRKNSRMEKVKLEVKISVSPDVVKKVTN